MFYTREQFRALCARTACIAALATLSCACGHSVSKHTVVNANGAATSQNPPMEVIVITASRGPSPRG
jgi:hypothetical protein